MIKLFRNIRKTLLEQNKMGKYFKYAIGEIILVVIGILIALQINNWNEDRKAKKNEAVLVNQLLIDAKKDAAFFRDRLIKLKNQIKFYDDIFNMCSNRPLTGKLNFKNIVSNQPFVRLAKQSSLIKNNPDAYNNLINKDLKLTLQKHVAEYEFASVSLGFFNSQMEEYITPLRVKHYKIFPGYAEVSSVKEFSFMCNNDELLGIVSLMKENAKSSIRNVNRFMASNTELSNALRNYLINNND